MAELTLQRVYDTFEVLPDWMDRYQFLIDLGKKLEPLSDSERVEDNKVRGCISQVWLVADPLNDTGEMHFRADSDAHIVKGLIAVALLLFNDKTPAEISNTDPEDVYGKLGLDTHLSVNRRNGFVSMMSRIKALAAANAPN